MRPNNHQRARYPRIINTIYIKSELGNKNNATIVYLYLIRMNQMIEIFKFGKVIQIIYLLHPS